MNIIIIIIISDLDLLFEIWTDPGFFQNPIRGLRFFDKQIGVGNLC